MCVPRDSPDMTHDKCFGKVGMVRACDAVNFWALNGNSFKMAKDRKFKFGRHAPSDGSHMTLTNVLEKVGVVTVGDPINFWC